MRKSTREHNLMRIFLAAGILAWFGGCRPAPVETPQPEASSATRPAPSAERHEPSAEPSAVDAPEGGPPETAEPDEELQPEEEEAQPEEEEAQPEPGDEALPEGEPDLGPPLVEHPENLEKLHPSYPAWFDKATKSVVTVGVVCQQQAPLELFACLRGSKDHESVVSVGTEAFVIHAGLLAAGAEPGGPAQFRPEYVPAHGTQIDVEVIFKDAQGRIQRRPAQDWVRNAQTGKAMTLVWVFAGSQFVTRESTGENLYLADATGELICVSNFPSAMLDVPVKSSDSDAALLFEAFTERIPPRGTPVTLVLTPKLEEQAGDGKPEGSDRPSSLSPSE